jgi:hypothetical protein
MRLLLGLLTLATTLAAQGQSDRRLIFSTFQGGDRTTMLFLRPWTLTASFMSAGESESRDLNGTPVGGKPLTFAVFKGYLTKYSPDGKQVIWRALIGGSSNTVPHAVALDKSGNVYVAGTTGARDLPLKNPVQDKQSGLNICFLMKFNAAGDLQFSTYFGGDRNEEGACACHRLSGRDVSGRAALHRQTCR